MTRPWRRGTQLLGGLLLYGVSLGLLVRAGLGLDPWNTFQEGVAEQLGVSLGTVVVAVGLLLLLLWVPLRQRPGIGTLANAVLIGVVVDASLHVLPRVDALLPRLLLLLLAVGLNAVATAAYIGAGLGPGPRDGLMTGLVQRTGLPTRVVRTSIEVTVLVVGVLLGGTVGLGTVVYALGIGPLVHPLLPRLAVTRAPDPGPDPLAA